MKEATKLPWEWYDNQWTNHLSIIGNIGNGSHETIFVCDEYSGRPSKADQDLLICAVNSHADMLAALKAVECLISESRGVDGYHKNGYVAEWDEFDLVNQLAAAIAKAEGKQ